VHELCKSVSVKNCYLSDTESHNQLLNNMLPVVLFISFFSHLGSITKVVFMTGVKMNANVLMLFLTQNFVCCVYTMLLFCMLL